MMNDVINRITMSVDNTIEDFLVRSVREEAFKTKTDIVINARKILEAVQKQIPKKPTGNKLNCCPSCEKLVGINTDIIHAKYSYCKYCGQAIDWSEEE